MRLTEVCSIFPGYTARARLEPAGDRGMAAIQLRDVSADGLAHPDELIRVDLGGVAERYMVSAGDVVFRSRGDRNTAAALDGCFIEPALALQPLLILRPKRDAVLPEYLAWAINQPSAQRHFDEGARGTNIRMVPKSCLDDLDIDVPDLEAQRRIVAVDALAERENQLVLVLAEKKLQLSRLLLAQHAQRICRTIEPERKRK